jgi:hypothetical protein
VETPLDEALLAALEAHREQWGGSEYVFTREDGKQLDAASRAGSPAS